MSMFISRKFLCLLIGTLCLSSSTISAQEEPIAVAAPVVQDTPKSEVVDAAKSDAAKPAEPDKRVRPLTVSIQLLRSDLVLTGALTDSTLLALKTAFGEASIPLSEVAGVRFPSGQDTSTTLVMLNGDSITGASDVKTVTVETEWGIAKVNGENISSMMFVPGLEWQNTQGLNGSRWTLTEAKAKPAAGASGLATGGGINSVPGLPSLPPSLPGPGAPASSSSAPRVVFPR